MSAFPIFVVICSPLSTKGRERSQDFAGAPVALFYGYSYCPDVCPMTLTLLANA